MKRITRVQILAFALCTLLSGSLYGDADEKYPVPKDLHGIWENENRFIEFTENKMRIVLKPYYRFVYEPFPPLSCTGIPLPSHISTEGVYSLSLRYPRDKRSYPLTLALADESLFLDFLVRLPLPGDGAGRSSELDGVWLPAGSVSALRLYPVDPVKDFYMFVFDNDRYFRVRYWKTDAREREINGHFTGNDGKEYHLPKFIRIDGILYTCITATGKVIRNFEEGRVHIKDDELRFKPDRVVFTGTEAAWRHPVPYTLDGNVLAFGEPYLVRSIVTNLDESIDKQNAKRRPPRKPIFDFLDLDFHWDEVERLRGSILDR